MYILTQNRKEIINVGQILNASVEGPHPADNRPFKICVRLSTDKVGNLGEYSTENRAKEVLEETFYVITSSGTGWIMPKK